MSKDPEYLNDSPVPWIEVHTGEFSFVLRFDDLETCLRTFALYWELPGYTALLCRSTAISTRQYMFKSGGEFPLSFSITPYVFGIEEMTSTTREEYFLSSMREFDNTDYTKYLTRFKKLVQLLLDRATALSYVGA